MELGEARPQDRSPEDVLRAALARVAGAPGRLADILGEHPQPLLAFTATRTILATNADGASFFGYGPRDLDGRPTDQIVPERLRQPDAPPQLATPDLTTVEVPGLRRDGAEVATVWTFGSAPGPDGPIFVMLVRDRAKLDRERAALETRERELERRFRAVYENAPDGITLIDDELRIVDANPAAARILGRSRETLLGRRTAELMPPGDGSTTPESVGAFRSAGAMTGEGTILLPDGTTRRAEFGAVANVSPGLHLSIFRDIEDRKRAEDTQRFLDEAASSLAGSLDYDETLASVARLAVPRLADWAAVDMLEADGALRRVAVAHADAAKVALAHELGRRGQASLRDRTGPGAVVRTGKPQVIERVTDELLVRELGGQPELLRACRDLGLVSAMTVPLSARGRVQGAITFISAESRRRYGPVDLAFAQELAHRAGHAVENALYVRDLRLANESKDLFLRRTAHLQATAMQLVRAESVAAIARAFESEEPTCPVDAHGWAIYMRVGDRLELLGASSNVRDLSRRWTPIPVAAQNPMCDAARTGEAMWLSDVEAYSAQYPDFVRRTRIGIIESRATIPVMAGDACIGVLGVLFERGRSFDSEERAYLTAVANLWGQALHRARLAEAEREASRRALEAETLATRKKDEFLAMLGHELRNPLAPIVTATSLLRVRGHATSRELDILDRQARHLVRLVDDLLDVSRITSGKLALTRGRLCASEVVAQAVESTSPLYEERQIRLHSQVSPKPMIIDGDRDRLVQVVANILVNAAKFTPHGKDVFLSASSDEEGVAIVVRDEGQGIEPELLPHVFDLFTQGRQSADRSTGGLGLGLAVAGSIARAHDGRIDIASPGAGLGTTVTVRLPIAAPAPAEADGGHGLAVPDTAPRAPRRRVLIVDDNEDSAELLAMFLGEVGYECFVAGSAARALSISREVIPDAALLDIGLPDLNGHDLARALRKALADRTPKLIALTGYAQERDRQLALEAGFVDHLAKPVEMSKLTATLSGLLGDVTA
jgi:PAS domain S-box-containing protein